MPRAWLNEEDQELRYAAKWKISPYIVASSLGRAVVDVMKRMSMLGLRKRKGYHERDPDTGEWSCEKRYQ